MNPVERNCANLETALSFYGDLHEEGGVKLITSPVTSAVFNIALLAAPVSPVPGELVRRIHLARSHFEATARAWSFWICEDWLAGRERRRLHDIFDHEGMQCIAESPGMEAGMLDPPRRVLPDLAFVPVEEDSSRRDFTNLVAECFRVQKEVARIIYEEASRWKAAPMCAWVGYLGRRAVTAAATVTAAGCLGVYSVATAPAERRRGCAEAVMRHAIDQARLAGAAGPLVLQSSPFGLRLYRQMGFKRTTRFFVYATL
jgi:GNAT superfamily N-acetyltransferase